MFTKRLAALVAVIAVGVAACSGGGGSVNTTPIPATTPAGSALSSSGQVISATGASGITSTVTVTGTGSVTAASSTTAPAGVAALTALARKSGESLKTAATVTDTALVYITLTASVASTITGLPSSSFTFATAPTGSIYLGATTGGTVPYSTIAGPGTLSGTTVTFGAVTPPSAISLAAGASLFLVVYTGGVIASASPSPSPSPTATATATPTASPKPSPTATATATATATSTATASAANLLTNGGFEAASLAPWVACFAKDQAEGPVDATPAIPPNEDTTPLPATSPTPAATTSPDLTAVRLATSVPSGNTGGTAAVHTGTYAALVGHSDLVLPSPTPTASPLLRPLRGKGKIGICQDVAVPAGGAQISMWVFEGGNTPSLYSNNTSAAIYPSGSFVDSGRGATAATAVPSQILFLEENCYDSLNFPTAFTPPGADCSPPSGVAVQGGVWKKKGPYVVSPSLNGTTVTIYLGIMGTSTSTTFYNYAYFDDVLMTSGTTTQSTARILTLPRNF